VRVARMGWVGRMACGGADLLCQKRRERCDGPRCARPLGRLRLGLLRSHGARHPHRRADGLRPPRYGRVLHVDLEEDGQAGEGRVELPEKDVGGGVGGDQLLRVGEG
jgi:hypothetical protein